MIYYLENKNLPGLLVSIDFEKAFDSIDWNYMRKVLKYFGFGEDICKWVYTFYNNIRSYVIVNGKISQRFSVQRGCRQGDPISPYLFVLCVELLACKIRQDDEIKGIRISDTEFKISQFADDTSFTLEGDQRSYERLFETLNDFEQISGLKINYEKTCNVWLGQKKNSKSIYLKDKCMTWNPKKLKILGLWFTNDLTNLTEMNLKDKLMEVDKLFKIWSKRICTPLGRIAILKSLILSKLVYLWILLPNPPNNEVKQLQNKCFEFVWDKKPDKIKRKYSIQKIENGGIGLPDVNVFIQALKLSWIRKLLLKNTKWKIILETLCPEVKDLNSFGSKKFIFSKCNQFWRDVFNAYDKLNSHIELDNEDITAEPIFLNSKFKINNSHFCFKAWIAKDLFLVGDILDVNGNFLSYETLVGLGIQTNYIHYLGCVRAIKEYARRRCIKFENNLKKESCKVLQTIISGNKGSQLYNDLLLDEIVIFDISSFSKWENKLNTLIDWKTVLKQTRKIKEIKMKWFQLRICHRILVSNIILKRMGVVHHDRCNFCDHERDTIHHFLWHCPISQEFWLKLENYFKEKCEHCERLTLNAELVLFGTDEKTKTDEIFDLIIVWGKFFIHNCRMEHTIPRVPVFVKELKHRYMIEKQTYTMQMSYHDFQKKWFPYNALCAE